jgi:MinD superfamily P-loop ATPase
MDMDVEEPNLHLFLNPEIHGKRIARMEIPVADESKCNRCAKCAELCQFKAISLLGKIILTYTDMCHGCGGCIAVCKEGALSAGYRDLGEILWGDISNGKFLMGKLRVGEAMSPPLMRQTKARLAEMTDKNGADVIIDAPPGVSCPAVNAVMDSDLILLVSEPTPFGLYDMKLAHQAFSQLNKPMAAIINRSGLGTSEMADYCISSGLEIMAEIPYDRCIAEAYSGGRIIADVDSDLRKLFTGLADRIRSLAEASVKREVRNV